MSRIIFQESYIVVVPTFDKTATHKHPFMHLFFGKDKCTIKTDKDEIKGNIILVDANVRHAVGDNSNCDFFLLIDPTSIIAEGIRDKYIQDNSYQSVLRNSENVYKDINELTDEEIIKFVKDMLFDIGISTENIHIRDERIEQVISMIISGEWIDYSVKQISDVVFLSESRLTHLFKEEVGISLKSYILIRRMERAYKYVYAGGKITQAAMESGFASSAHLAYCCKTLTGISITDVLKNTKLK